MNIGKPGPAHLVLVSEVKINLRVRQALDEDRVLFFAGLLESGQDIPPIELTPEKEILNGRHRLEAFKLCDKQHIPARIIPVKSRLEAFAVAVGGNMGGALPPTVKDITFTMVQMLNEGMKEKQIAEVFSTLPRSLVRRYLNTAASTIRKRKVEAAAALVINGHQTVANAAAESGVEVDALKCRLGQQKASAQKASGMKGTLVNILSTSMRSVGNRLKMLVDLVDDGETSKEEALAVIDAASAKAKQQIKRLDEWRERIEQRQ